MGRRSVMSLYNSISYIILLSIQILQLSHTLSCLPQLKMTSHPIEFYSASKQLKDCHIRSVTYQMNRMPMVIGFYIYMTTLSEQFIQKAILNTAQDEKCSHLHPGVTCNLKMLQQFGATCKSLYKMYLLVHLIPFIIFKRKKFKNRPAHEIGKLVVAFIKSMLFAGGYTLVARRTICFLTTHYKFSSVNGLVGAFLGGATLCFEPAGRQSEIALYCVNKTLQTIYHMGKRRNYPVKIPYGECLLVGLGISIICFHYADCPSAIISNYQRVLEKVLGNV